ncbi:MAG: choloylglycine hydrolase [Clostridia bacterium]|nr:choloylglycine hydrolase [Clostridia bacterium]
MCTALCFTTRDHYFGRNLDLEYALNEAVTVAPRRFPFAFRRMPAMKTHLAMIGVATTVDGYPLYYDATNEAGLSMAGLNFPGNAHYPPEAPDRDNVSPFEFIPYILGQCATIPQAKALLARINLAAMPFSDALPLSPLHWLIASRSEAIVVEPMADGLHIHDNPVGVLTNNPPFPYHLTNLSNYRALTSQTPENRFAPALDLPVYSRGMGGLGLPGDLTSPSRFVRAAFMKAHSLCGSGEAESVTQFFHMLSSVRHVRGSVMVEGKPEITVYSSCCNTDKGVYYYTTYENSRITAVDMRKEDLSGDALAAWPLVRTQQFCDVQG